MILADLLSLLLAATLALNAGVAAAEEADSTQGPALGGPVLTPVGAERGGNADGTIPPCILSSLQNSSEVANLKCDTPYQWSG